MIIAICDDEELIREQVKNLVVKQQPDAYVNLYGTGEELLAENRNFDMVFLDIQMDGMNGIEAARKLRERNAQTIVIFITGMREYVFEAFDVHAFQYLLKPIMEEKFREVFLQAEAEAGRREKYVEKLLWIKNGKRKDRKSVV